jgi:hypothetical protein
MDTSAFQAVTVEVGLGLFMVVCFLCLQLARHRRSVLLLIWPVLIYFCGPTMTAMFSDNPVLSRYVFADAALAETLIMFAYVAALYVADRVLNLSEAIRASFSSPEIRRLARSPIFLLIYIPVAIATVILQLKILHDLGSALAGGQYAMEAAAEGLIPYWGFLAGLYEVLFVFVVLFLLSEQPSKFLSVLVMGLYVLAAVLRVAGGTRLLLIKELAVILIVFYMRGKIKGRRLAVMAVSVVLLGSAVGLLRSSGSDLTYSFLGPLYGLIMESGLNALTFNIAYHVQDSGFVVDHAHLLDTLEFIVLSAVPSFLRFGVGQADLDAISPYTVAVAYGFDTSDPVGGMSGFGTLCYLGSYPLVATLALVAALACLIKYTPKGAWKHIILLVFCINAIHFWRDPIDIAVKDFVQDVVCALALLYIPNPRKSQATSAVPLATAELSA